MDIHIFMCSWKRLYNLPILIKCLEQQTCDNKIILNIWNNNIDNIQELDNFISSKIQLNIHHSDKNYYAFGRFMHIKQLKDSYNIKFAVIIDDDELFSTDYIQKLWDLREQNTFVTWYGSILNGRSYWDRSIINMNDIKQNLKQYITEYEYGGPGGCIIDTSIVDDEDFMNINSDYLIADDIWLSYYCRSILNWKIRRSFMPPTMLETKNDTKVAMWTTSGKDKHLIYDELLKKGWKPIKENCIVSLGVGKEYYKGIERLRQMIKKLNISCDYFGYTEYPENIPSHEENMYAFKYHLIKQKFAEGYKRIMWLDASVVPTNNLDSIWSHIDKYSYMIYEIEHDLGHYTSDKCLDYFNIKRKKVAYNIKSCAGGLVGFKNDEIGNKIINEMYRLSKETDIFIGSYTNENMQVSTNKKVKGHRHDQSVLTLLLYKLALNIRLHGYIEYNSPIKCDYTKYINDNFVVDRQYVGRF